jgi:hypothetical protein
MIVRFSLKMLSLQGTAIASQKPLNPARPAAKPKIKNQGRSGVDKSATTAAVPLTSSKQRLQPQKQKEERPPTRLELALSLLASPEDPERCGAATVLFNHYRKQFAVWNGVVLFEDIDREYSFSFVYKGKFTRYLRLDGDEDGPPCSSSEDYNFFLGVDPKLSYRIFVEEDPEAGVGVDGLTIHEGPLRLGTGDTSVHTPQLEKQENRKVRDITESLKKMEVKDLHSAEAKQLREARDLEDILYR